MIVATGRSKREEAELERAPKEVTEKKEAVKIIDKEVETLAKPRNEPIQRDATSLKGKPGAKGITTVPTTNLPVEKIETEIVKKRVETKKIEKLKGNSQASDIEKIAGTPYGGEKAIKERERTNRIEGADRGKTTLATVSVQTIFSEC